jgi:hypothetical protein
LRFTNFKSSDFGNSDNPCVGGNSSSSTDSPGSG